ncbi:acyltransferase [Mesorhizobium sp. RP14(2022)]|uniref:Acyltransferase n=1 Tax=Mesorhizobium liriopis TaxID=2953882 RepID=A0ABT1C7S6_9HYPH|nr:acyltransferase [Mesorhizobium liriopis]MCO6050827.1 acyltransferase [Mesorhizobium liriopis]
MAAESIEKSDKSLYLPSLDGLRCLAFLLVFVHHMPAPQPIGWLEPASIHGWVGVELFFVISAFLFFYLFEAERSKTGRVSYSGFYIRRMLRIYPLMIAFPLLMLVLYGSTDQFGILRLAGLALASDNLLTWIRGYNTSIPNVAHLWSLSFEFQIYLVIPVLFALYVKAPRPTFFAVMGLALVICTALRVVYFGMGAPHPIIWTTPFFRPESVMLGILLSVIRPRWHWGWSLSVAVLAGAFFFSNLSPWQSSYANLVQYPIAALMCAALVDAVVRSPSLGRVASHPVLIKLGSITFGLYVFHIFAMDLAFWYVGKRTADTVMEYVEIGALSLSLTILMAAVSYMLLERPFLSLKRRVTAVDGRAKIKSLQLQQSI